MDSMGTQKTQKDAKVMRLMWIVMLLVIAGCAEKPGEGQAAGPFADLVLVNGGIYTVDAERSRAEAAAVRDGVFVAVGSNAEVEALRGPETRVIDLSGRLALPGFHDAHVHPRMGGAALLGCNLADQTRVDAIVARVSACAAEGEGWVYGHAFDLGLFGQDGPHKRVLDAIPTDRPIFLESSDGHNAWVNSIALERAGITAETPDPPLGVIERDPDGAPSGTLRETASDLVEAVIPAPTAEEDTAALLAGIQHLNSFGITSYIDAWIADRDYEAYRRVAEDGALTARVVTSLRYPGDPTEEESAAFEAALASRGAYATDGLSHDSVKIFLDGVLEGEIAALLEPYVGLNHSGELIFPPEALNAAVTRFDAMGLQVHMHAIGDRAVRAGLDAIAAARAANGPSENRHHISHLQMIHVDDIERFARLDTAANFQALWAYPDDWIMQLNLPVLGEERVQGMYPIASVARAGGRIVGGSDWNVSSANPLDAIETAVRRQDAFAEGGPVLNADERVSLATMIDAYTINAAWVMHQEDRVGSIEVGKRADVVVLDRDPFAAPATEINEARVVETLLDGATVWRRRDGN